MLSSIPSCTFIGAGDVLCTPFEKQSVLTTRVDRAVKVLQHEAGALKAIDFKVSYLMRGQNERGMSARKLVNSACKLKFSLRPWVTYFSGWAPTSAQSQCVLCRTPRFKNIILVKVKEIFISFASFVFCKDYPVVFYKELHKAIVLNLIMLLALTLPGNFRC